MEAVSFEFFHRPNRQNYLKAPLFLSFFSRFLYITNVISNRGKESRGSILNLLKLKRTVLIFICIILFNDNYDYPLREFMTTRLSCKYLTCPFQEQQISNISMTSRLIILFHCFGLYVRSCGVAKLQAGTGGWIK